MPGPLARLRNAAPLLVLALLLPSPAPAQVPAGAEAAAARLLQRVGPQTRNWIRQEAAPEHAAGTASESAARRGVGANPSFGALPGGDVEALVFLVLMEAAKSAQEDQKAMMEQMKQVNEAKAALRHRMQQTKRESAELAGNARNRDANAPQRIAARPALSPERAAVHPRPLPKAQFDRQLRSARDDYESLNEMGEAQSLRLQMAMDRRAKLMSTLSNMLKKMSETNATMTSNLK